MVPISEHQDTVGPIVRSVADAAAVLSVIAGKDPNDNFTLAQPSPVPDYTKALDKNALRGKRIGVPRAVFLNDSISGNDPFVNQVFEQALDTLRSLGATVVDPADLPSAEAIVESNNETVVLDTDFKVRIHIGRAARRVNWNEPLPDPTKRVLRGAAQEPVRRANARRPDRVR